MLVIAALFLTLASTASAGAPSALIDVGNGSGNPGDTGIVVAVSLASDPGANVASLDFDLSFDSSRLAYVSTATGPAASAAVKDAQGNLISPGTIRVIVFGLKTNVIGDGVVAIISFNVLGGAAPGDSSLSLSNTTVSDNSPTPQPVVHGTDDGTFTVIQPPTNTPTNT